MINMINVMRFAKLMLVMFFVNVGSYVFTQEKTTPGINRNVKVKRYSKILPEEVCIPKGYWISFVRKEIDVNKDSLSDFVFDWNKPVLQDGDTLYLTVYKQNKDSSFSHLKTFSNLFPLYFKRYDRDYRFDVKLDSFLNQIHSRYDDGYPLEKLEFSNSKIIIKIRTSVTDGITLFYEYDLLVNNWLLIKREDWFENPLSGEFEVTNTDKIKTKEFIDDFDYLDYLY